MIRVKSKKILKCHLCHQLSSGSPILARLDQYLEVKLEKQLGSCGVEFNIFNEQQEEDAKIRNVKIII